ncbi:unnamed protein product, partial [Closterium sp. NIES-54]
MARNDGAAVSPKRLSGGTTIVLLLALLIPDPTGMGTGGTRGAGHYFAAEAIPFIEQSQRKLVAASRRIGAISSTAAAARPSNSYQVDYEAPFPLPPGAVQ